MENYFPKIAQSPENIEYYSLLKKYNNARLARLLGIDNKEEIEKIEDDLTPEPQKIGELEIKMQTGFEQNCLVIGQHFKRKIDPYNFSQFSYYNALNLIKEQTKDGKSNQGKRSNPGQRGHRRSDR